MSNIPILDDETFQLNKKYNALKQQYTVHSIIIKAILRIDLKNLPTEIDKLKIQRMLKLLRIKDYIKLANKTSHINDLGNFNNQI